MGIFSTSSPFDQYIERATSEKNTSDDWGQIMDICDKVKESNTGPKDCLRSLVKRLNSENPRIVLQAITLLDACINNCERKFLLEVASRDFEQELKKLLTSARTHHKVSERLRESLKKWAEGEFKGDSQLSLIPALYAKLKQDGYDFNVQSDSPKKATTKYSTDPNVVNSKQEEDDIVRAIQLSLQESGGNGNSGSQSSRSSNLYSLASAALTSDGDSVANVATSPPAKEPQKARALYDFEAAEDNELTFKAGEIVVVQDSSDPNWWKGSNHRGDGLFPANFVTLDLNVESEQPRSEGGKRVSFSECVEVTEVEGAGNQGTLENVELTGEVDEEKIDNLLHVLHEADPTGERPDPPQLAVLEEQVNAMAPTIDAELEQIDRKHAQLARISTDLVDALGLYHQLMRDMPPAMSGYFPIPKNAVGAPGQMPAYAPSPTPGMPPQQMYGGPGQFVPYMVPPPPGAPVPQGAFPSMPPSTAAGPSLPPPQAQLSTMPMPNQPLPTQPAPVPSQPMPHTAQPVPQATEFHQMPSASHDGSGGSMMPGFGQFPGNSHFGPPPATQSGVPPDHSSGPPTSFPAYSQPQTVQQPLL